MAQWWDEWQLRILVLSSLITQYSLVISAVARKFHIPPWLRVPIRLAHIGSDALALFALATLFNRQKNGPKCSYTHGSRDLELLWAPILLMHLGGQVVITAHKIEDNEQWTRYIMTSVSKVTVALYVFYKSWSSRDKRLFAATILLFILVILRCFQKALDLKRCSFSTLQKTIHPSEIFRPIIKEVVGLEEYIRKARNIIDPPPLLLNLDGTSYYWNRLCVDFPHSYSDRLSALRRSWRLTGREIYIYIEAAISDIIRFFYTKDDGISSLVPHLHLEKMPDAPAIIIALCVVILPYAMLITVIYLFHSSIHKKSYSGGDIRVTHVLLYGTLLLDLLYFCMQIAEYKLSGRMLQHSLIGLFAHNKRHAILVRIAGWLQCEDFLDQFWHMKSSDSCMDITMLVLEHVKDGWKNHITDANTYMIFNDYKGELTMQRYKCEGLLKWSFQQPFDESIIVWHVATDLCFYHEGTSPDDQCARRCRQMSNYMLHLLYANPEMLMVGSRKSLLRSAYNDLEVILEGKATLLCQDEKDVTHNIMQKLQGGDCVKEGFVCDAWALSKMLLDQGGEKWKVIEGVWVEMLCFSAGRCRGYLHVQSLGTSVEYLSYVWIALANMGMEIFPDKLQRRDQKFEREEVLATPPDPLPSDSIDALEPEDIV